MSTTQTQQINYSVPPTTLTQASTLNENVKNLRTQLSNIQKLLQTTNDSTQISYQEMQDKIASNDISQMAVQQLKASTAVKIRALEQQCATQQQQLEQLQKENYLLKQKYSESSQQADLATSSQNEAKKQLENILEQKQQLQQENTSLQEQILQLQNQLQLAVTNYTQISNESQSTKQQLQTEVITLQTENQQLTQTNKQLQAKLADFSQVDVETANIELANAAKTVTQLQKIIQDLKDKLEEQKQTHFATVQSLRTTIAALQEEIFGDDNDDENQPSRNDLEKKIVELSEQNETLRKELEKYQNGQQQTQYGGNNKAWGAAQSVLQSMNLYQQNAIRPQENKQQEQNIEELIRQSRMMQ